MGPVTGLPIPRFVSLKSDRVNLHEGPSKDHRTTWIFQRAGLPVEIIAEFDIWRRIRDSEGSEGWVLHSLLSGRRTAIVAPWRKSDEFPIRKTGVQDAAVTARLQSGVIGSLKTCNGAWCRFAGEGFDGWIEQQNLWGAYPGEKTE
jgi:SH3-like domain-containing protein